MEELRGRGSRRGPEVVPARDITKRQMLRVRVLLGTPGAGLEMSWCIQKPPDAKTMEVRGNLGQGAARKMRANPKYWVLAEYGRGGCNVCRRGGTGYMRRNDAGRRWTGANARGPTAQTNMTTVRILQTQDALLTTITTENYEAAKSEGCLLAGGQVPGTCGGLLNRDYLLAWRGRYAAT